PSGLGGQDEEIYHAVLSPTVRRLTPLECERLQGFPDGWTDIPGNSDTQRYRQLGNAVCVPVVEWIMRRIAEAGWVATCSPSAPSPTAESTTHAAATSTWSCNRSSNCGPQPASGGVSTTQATSPSRSPAPGTSSPNKPPGGTPTGPT